MSPETSRNQAYPIINISSIPDIIVLLSRISFLEFEIHRSFVILSQSNAEVKKKLKLNSVALVRERTIPTDRATAACWQS
jgi:hypothetical protein